MRLVKFLDLPMELLCHILGYVEIVDLLQCSLTAKKLHKLIKESSCLQYAIQLYRYRMVPTCTLPPSLTVSSKLKMLRSRERAWSRLKWGGTKNFDIPFAGSVYEFAGGVYAHGAEDSSAVASQIQFFQLPCEGTNLKTASGGFPASWTHLLPEHRIIDFTMHPSQDLLVLVILASQESSWCYEIHLRTLSTNEPHPKAPSDILHCLSKTPGMPQLPGLDIAAIRVQIVGDLIAILLREIYESAQAHLEIWNWKSDVPTVSFGRQKGMDDFIFLSSDRLLVVLPEGRFQVYAFEFPGAHTPSQRFRVLVEYDLPPLAPGYAYWYISISVSPTDIALRRQGGQASDDTLHDFPAPTYYPRFDERIISCCLYIFSPSTETDIPVHSFVFFVNAKTFLKDPHEWIQTAQHSPNLDLVPMPRSLLDALLTPRTPSPNGALAGSSSPSPAPFLLPSLTSVLENPWEILLNHSAISLASEDVGSSVPLISWSQWGRDYTRWFTECLRADWQHASFGYRTIESVPIEATDHLFTDTVAGNSVPAVQDSNSAVTNIAQPAATPVRSKMCRLRMRDFNPYNLYPDTSLYGADEEGTGSSKKHYTRNEQIVTTPSITPTKGVFVHDIVSGLAYREVTTEETFDASEVMMDDSRVLLLKRAKPDRLKTISVLLL